MSKLEKDFDKVRKQINKKIEEAAAALSEANKIAEKAGIKYLTTAPNWMYDEFSSEEMEELQQKIGEYGDPSRIDFNPLFGALEESGWTPSSMRC